MSSRPRSKRSSGLLTTLLSPLFILQEMFPYLLVTDLTFGATLISSAWRIALRSSFGLSFSPSTGTVHRRDGLAFSVIQIGLASACSSLFLSSSRADGIKKCWSAGCRHRPPWRRCTLSLQEHPPTPPRSPPGQSAGRRLSLLQDSQQQVVPPLLLHYLVLLKLQTQQVRVDCLLKSGKAGFSHRLDDSRECSFKGGGDLSHNKLGNVIPRLTPNSPSNLSWIPALASLEPPRLELVSSAAAIPLFSFTAWSTPTWAVKGCLAVGMWPCVQSSCSFCFLFEAFGVTYFQDL